MEGKYVPKFRKNGVNLDWRIIGGKPAKAGEFRGQVSFYRVQNLLENLCVESMAGIYGLRHFFVRFQIEIKI